MRLAADFVNFSIFYAWLCSLFFLVAYTGIVPWWKRRPGWVATMHGWAMLVLLTPLVLHYLVHLNTQHLWFSWYLGFSFFMSGTVELIRLWLVWSLQTWRRNANKSKETS